MSTSIPSSRLACNHLDKWTICYLIGL